MRLAVPLAAIVLAATTRLAAQSINIDLGRPDAPRPADAYRGVGLPGFWNKFDALGSGVHYPLYDTKGVLTPATSYQIGGTEIVTTTLGGAGDPEGDDAILLSDTLVTHTATENCLFFDGLQAGTYEVLLYAWMPTAPSTPNRVRVDNNPSVRTVSGAWPGAQAENVTYARLFVDVTGAGTLGTHSGVPSGGNYGVGAALNGIQIRRLVQQPSLYVERGQLQWLSSLGAGSYDVVRGDLAVLRATHGDFSLATVECLANNLADTQLARAATPSVDAGDWFLVRGVGAGGALTWNSPGSAQAASRDPGIAAAAASCP